MLRVPRQDVLQAFEEKSQEQRDEAEQKHRGSVLTPGHFLAASDAGDAVDESFERAEKVVLARKHSCHVGAQRAHTDKENSEVDQKLEPSNESHVRTSPGRAGPR